MARLPAVTQTTRPAGANRFRAPQPPAAWTGVFDAGKNGPQCPQHQISGTGASPRLTAVFGMTGDAAESSQDCLCLNVFTPTGNDALYDGVNIAMTLNWARELWSSILASKSAA